MGIVIRVMLIVHCSLLLGGAALADGKPERSESYRPFEIVSTTQDKTMSSEYLESELMCKSTWENLAANMDLLKNYHIISTGGDDSMGITRFAGLQDGEIVTVDVMVTHPDHIFRYVAVNDELVLSCNY